MNTFTPFCLCTFLTLSSWSSIAFAQIIQMPNLNLRQAVREALVLPNEIPITRQKMLQLTRLGAKDSQKIADLTGLEYATNLTGVTLPYNEISLQYQLVSCFMMPLLTR